MPKPPALVDRRNTNIPISVLNSSIRCILQNTRHHASGLGKHPAPAPELNTEVGMSFWKRGQWHCTAAPKYRCYIAGKKVPTGLCSDQRNTQSDRWIAKSENRLKKRFLMITEHKESVGRQWKTNMKMGRQGMNFTSWKSSVPTSHARAETDISSTREVTPQQEWQLFEIKEKA